MSKRRLQQSKLNPQRSASSPVSTVTVTNTVHMEPRSTLKSDHDSGTDNLMSETKSSHEHDADMRRSFQLKAEAILREKPDVIDKMKKDIKFYGITAEDLGFTSKPSGSTSKVKSKPPVKYRKGDLTWSGLGRAPKWVRDIKADPNDNLDNYLVT